MLFTCKSFKWKKNFAPENGGGAEVASPPFPTPFSTALLSEMEYKNTRRVDLPEVDFALHENNPKVKEVAAQGFPCPPSFHLTLFLLTNLSGCNFQ